jgi:hypothetical protein
MPVLKCRPIIGLPVVKGKINTRLTKITADCTNEKLVTKPTFEGVDFMERGLFLFRALCAEKIEKLIFHNYNYFK